MASRWSTPSATRRDSATRTASCSRARSGGADFVSYRIGFDVGGTFTDFVLQSPAGELTTAKRLTTYPDPSEACLAGLDALLAAAGVAWSDVAQAVHGTTLGSNVVIERKARGVGLLTTRGFRDVLLIGREKRYQVYDLQIEKPRQRGQPLLVLRVEVRVQQADREGGDAAIDQRADRAARVGFVQRRPHRAVGEHALGDLADQAPRHERARLLDLEVVDLVALLAPDEQHVAEAARGEQADAARLALDDDVAAERRAVHGLRDVAPGHAGGREQRVEARQARLGRIGIGGEALGGGQLARGRLQHEVRERTAHVEADPVRHEISSAAPRARAGRDTGSAVPSGS